MIEQTLEKLTAAVNRMADVYEKVVEAYKAGEALPPIAQSTTAPATETKKPGRPKKDAPVAAPAAETTPPAQAAPAADPLDAELGGAPEVTYTLDQVRAALVTLSGKSPEMKEKVKDIINKTGNAATISTILPEKFASVMAAVEAASK